MVSKLNDIWAIDSDRAIFVAPMTKHGLELFAIVLIADQGREVLSTHFCKEIALTKASELVYKQKLQGKGKVVNK